MKKVNIKNYTSSVPATTSLARIEEYLESAGAQYTTKDYSTSTKECIGIIFVFLVNEQSLQFRIRPQTEECYNVLIKEYVKKTPVQQQNCREQASRTAWKIISDWVEIQTTMILLGQAKPEQLFLHSLYNMKTEKTLFESMSENNFKLLNA